MRYPGGMLLAFALACATETIPDVPPHGHDGAADTGAVRHDHGHDLPEHDHDHEHPASEPYTDERAVAAVQNDDPWSDPERANLEHLWHHDARGYQWLERARWTMDNRTDPPGVGERHELLQLFHETVACADGDDFADCNSTAALKIYANGPRIDTHDWSPEGYAAAAVRPQHTHASGIYLVSFGQNFVPADVGYGVIAPSGVHLEPHGAHQALRVDGTGNAGQNVRIDVMAGGTGLAVYGSEAPAAYCEELGLACDETRLATLRGGVVRLEDVTVERSIEDARGAGVVTVSADSVGVEPFYSWHTDDETGLPVHCAWNDTVTDDSVVRISAYTSSPDLVVAHSYAVVSVWGPGNAPAS